MIKEYFGKLKDFGAYKILLILLAGILLIMSGKTEGENDNTVNGSNAENNDKAALNAANNLKVSGSADLEDELSALLSQINGISEVCVMVTFEDNGEKVLIYSENTSKTSSGVNEADNTQSSSESISIVQEYLYENETPYVVKEIMPAVRGVVVVYKGDKAFVSDIAESVKVLTGVEYNKIKVLAFD